MTGGSIGAERSVPGHYRLQYTEDQIRESVARLGTEISGWASQVAIRSGRDILAIPVLRGGIYFFADLSRQITCSIELAPGRARSYENTGHAVQSSQVSLNLDGVDVTGRSVLLIDDICDSGRTLSLLTRFLVESGAVEVRSVVLIKREMENSAFEPNWKGFAFRGPEWFIGFGMDDCSRWSNLPSIYVIDPAGAS